LAIFTLSLGAACGKDSLPPEQMTVAPEQIPETLRGIYTSQDESMGSVMVSDVNITSQGTDQVPHGVLTVLAGAYAEDVYTISEALYIGAGCRPDGGSYDKERNGCVCKGTVSAEGGVLLVNMSDEAGCTESLSGAFMKGAPKVEPPPPAKRARVKRILYKVTVDPESDPIRGAVESMVSVVVFGDYECPSTAALMTTMASIQKVYEEKVRLVYKQNPQDAHTNATAAANASLCAKEQGKFWEMHDLLFANQQALSTQNLQGYAKQLKLKGKAFDKCMKSDGQGAKIAADKALAAKVGVTDMPMTFINGRKMEGTETLLELKKVVEAEHVKAKVALRVGISPGKLYNHLIRHAR
jgi:protein-disulfide isomerase